MNLDAAPLKKIIYPILKKCSKSYN